MAQTVTRITDAEANVTTLEYDFDFSQGSTSGTQNGNGKKLCHLKHGKADETSKIVVTDADKFFEDGTTKVVDALGNNRAFWNAQEYVDGRVANASYATYNASQDAPNPRYQAQVDAIKNAHSLTYTYRDDGYITEV